MAIKFYDWSGSTQYQGGFGKTEAEAKRNKKTMYLSFQINDELKDIANNIRIDSAKLFLVCGNSGKGSAKEFTFSRGLNGAITSTGAAQNNTCYLNLGEGHNLRTYLANGGGEIATYDNSSTYHRTNSGSGYYTENYCSVSSARLEIQYTILQSSLTTYPSSIIINKSNSYTISSSSSSYKHKLTLSIAGKTLTLLDGVARGTHSFTAPSSWAKNFPNASSASATLILETKDGNTSLGTNTYSNIVVKVDGASGVNPVATINSITTKDSYAISGSSQIEVSIAGTAKEGASIKTYTLKVGSSSYTYASAGTKTITASGSGAQAFSLEVIDSRGLSSTSSSTTRYITNYVAPALKTGAQPLQRVDGSGNASIQGKYYSFTYAGVDYCNIVNFSTGSNIANSVSITITINGVTSQITSSPWRSTREYAVDQSYTATVKITDLRTTVTYTFDAPSASYLIHFLEQKNSVGIGCAAEALANGETGKITMGWPVSFKGSASIAGGLAISGELKLSSLHPLSVKCGGTGATTIEGAQKKLEIIDLVYPVGSIYMSMNATNPKDLFGIGTWERCGVGRVPVGVSPDTQAFSTAGNSGGSMTHTLTVDEMPPHQHYPSDRDSHTITENGVVYKSQFVTVANMGSAATGRYQVGTSSSSNLWTVASKGRSDQEKYGVSATSDTSSVGGGQSFSTMPPYFVCYMWKRVA